jgi:hypothetical protein
MVSGPMAVRIDAELVLGTEYANGSAQEERRVAWSLSSDEGPPKG